MSSAFEDYSRRFRTIKMTRENGILQLTFHTDEGPLFWSRVSHSEFGEAFGDIARDPENKVVIMTGTGVEFSGPTPSATTRLQSATALEWDKTFRDAMQLTTGLLNMDSIVISCVNGPATRHPEIPLLADIVLAVEDSYFCDSGHFPNRAVPGDGVNFIFPMLLGLNRARYFLLTGQVLSTREARELGLVNEIVEREKLLPRAWELAEQLVTQNPLVLRYTRMLFTQQLKKMSMELLGYGLALEGLAQLHEAELQSG